jgi:2-dehydropantoate 2-reductase
MGDPTAIRRVSLEKVDVARIGSPYRPSILDDFEAGRRTEGEHTIGDLVRRADLRGVAVPILRAALCNVQVHEGRVRK